MYSSISLRITKLASKFRRNGHTKNWKRYKFAFQSEGFRHWNKAWQLRETISNVHLAWLIRWSE